jgi:hypothetical protein
MSGPTIHKSDNAIRVVVVTNGEQLLHAYAVRSICFMEETGLPARRAFDGNDFQASHFVIYCEDEPIGATRIRWFNGFAKIERTGLRQAYRNARILKQTAEFIFEHVARKGYSKLVTLAQPKYAAMCRHRRHFDRHRSQRAGARGRLLAYRKRLRSRRRLRRGAPAGEKSRLGPALFFSKPGASSIGFGSRATA